MTLTDLALFRSAELVPTDAPLYDPTAVAEEAVLATLAVAGRLSADTLLSPAGQSLVRAADPATLPTLAYGADGTGAGPDTSAEYALRGRLVVGLPDDFHALVRVRLSRWTAALDTVLTAGSGLDPYPHDARYGASVVGNARVDRPQAFIRAHVFAPDDFPTPPSDPADASGGRLRSALVLAPAFDPETGAVDTVAEILYVPERPDPERLRGTLRDAVAWETAGRLLGQDAETRGLAADAAARAEAVLRTLPAKAASIAVRGGLLF